MCVSVSLVCMCVCVCVLQLLSKKHRMKCDATLLEVKTSTSRFDIVYIRDVESELLKRTVISISLLEALKMITYSL